MSRCSVNSPGARRASTDAVFFSSCAAPCGSEGEGRLERVVLERNRLQGAPFQQSARGTREISHA